MQKLTQIEDLFYLNHDVYSGEYVCYFNNGKIQIEGFIHNGYLDSISRYYDRSGNLAETVWFQQGKPKRRTLYRNTINSRLVINLKGDVEHGFWERYYLNGQIQEHREYNNGKSVGVWKTWDTEGKVITETDFTQDPIVSKIHSYKKRKHITLIRYTDKNSGKQIRREKLVL